MSFGDEVVEGNGWFLMFGLVNGYFYFFVNYMKGCLLGLLFEIFMFYECLELEILWFLFREVYFCIMFGCMEMFECGMMVV